MFGGSIEVWATTLFDATGRPPLSPKSARKSTMIQIVDWARPSTETCSLLGDSFGLVRMSSCYREA